MLQLYQDDQAPELWWPLLALAAPHGWTPHVGWPHGRGVSGGELAPVWPPYTTVSGDPLGLLCHFKYIA